MKKITVAMEMILAILVIMVFSFSASAAGGSISGTVFQSDGSTPVPDEIPIWIQVVQPRSQGSPCFENRMVIPTFTIKDPGGTYTISDLPPGDYYLGTLSLGLSDYVNEWWAKTASTFSCIGAEPVTVSEGVSLTGINFQLDTGGSISGTVYESVGQTPLVLGAVVALEGNNPNGLLEFRGLSPLFFWNNGKYTIRGLPPGNYYLLLNSNTSPNYTSEWWASAGSTYHGQSAEPVTLAQGQVVTGKNFQLDPAGSISGTVYKSNGSALTGEEVEIIAFQGNPCGFLQLYQTPAWTDPSDGTYTLLGLPPGKYYLAKIDKSNYVNEWWANGGSTAYCSGAESITVAAGEDVVVKNFQLDPAGSISGRVYKSDGTTPLTGEAVTVVAIYGEDACGPLRSHLGIAWTDPRDGKYKISGQPSGKYYLKTIDNGHVNYTDEWWASGGSTPYCSGAESINVVAGVEVTGKDFQLDPAGSISGRVYKGDGTTPLTGEAVLVVASQGSPCGHTFGIGGYWTNPDDGKYTFLGLAPGNYYLFAHEPNQANYSLEWWASGGSTPYHCSGAEPITVVAGTEVTGKNFQLDPSLGSISGTVFRSDGVTPVTGVLVSVAAFQGRCEAGDRIGGITETNPSNGTYTLSGLPPGKHYLVALTQNQADYANEFWTSTGSTSNCSNAETVTVGNSPITGKNFQLDLGTSISGTVYKSDGVTPLTGKPIEVGALRGDPCGGSWLLDKTFTNPKDGTYTIKGVPPGQYYLRTDNLNLCQYINEWWASPGSSYACSDAIPLTVGVTPLTGIDFQLDLIQDADDDGISDEIDTAPGSPSNDFSDGKTSGTVTDRGDQVLTIKDAPDPNKGIWIAAAGGSAKAKVSACNGKVRLSLGNCNEAIVTCGSVIVEVISGTVEITLVGDDGTVGTTSVDAGNSINFEPTTFTITAPETNSDTVVVKINGMEISLNPGEVMVSIDIKPGSYPNCFNQNERGAIPVAIFGSTALNVKDIDIGSLLLQGLLVKVTGKSNKYLAHFEDINNDGYDDLIVQFQDSDGWMIPGSGYATLTGQLYNGTPIEGQDTICIVP